MPFAGYGVLDEKLQHGKPGRESNLYPKTSP